MFAINCFVESLIKTESLQRNPPIPGPQRKKPQVAKHNPVKIPVPKSKKTPPTRKPNRKPLGASLPQEPFRFLNNNLTPWLR